MYEEHYRLVRQSPDLAPNIQVKAVFTSGRSAHSEGTRFQILGPASEHPTHQPHEGLASANRQQALSRMGFLTIHLPQHPRTQAQVFLLAFLDRPAIHH